MSYELTGKLIAKYEIIQRKETFKTREFVIEKTDDINGKIITNYVKFQCVQDRTTMPDRFNLGDTVKVLFNIKGSRPRFVVSTSGSSGTYVFLFINKCNFLGCTKVSLTTS